MNDCVGERRRLGAYNTAAGYGAPYSNTTGNYNAAFGYEAMYSNQAGVYNLVVGGNALYYNANGYNNMALGCFALYNNQGNSRNDSGVGGAIWGSHTTRCPFCDEDAAVHTSR